ncbi:yippee zinc-binding/DNA-binding /Mis18, centromere assembly-domain-containing protein, partial [Phyllosticta capitalensis]
MHSSPSPFPIYLLPSIPFRRRSSSATTTTNGTTSVSAPSSPPSSPPRFLSGHRAHLRCTRCLTDLCLTSQIISKGFTGRHGRAYLVAPPDPYPYYGDGTPGAYCGEFGMQECPRGENNLPNTHTHKPVPRQLVTGAHTVSDISCALCGAVLGWKYVAADEESQKYKVGKFILETKRVCRGVCWENEDAADDDNHIEFDSQDEDECEDLFAGVWSPALARKRRRGRLW